MTDTEKKENPATGQTSEIPDALLKGGMPRAAFNMNEVVGTHDILFLCLDTLRWDAAAAEEEAGGTPVLNSYGKWVKCGAPGNFTYPSHHAMFAGFLPQPMDRSMGMNLLFFPKNIGLGRNAPPDSFAFEGANFIEGLSRIGYDTHCIGGVAFFDKRTPIGKVFPSFFQKSYWKPAFGCPNPDSTRNQADLAIDILTDAEKDRRIFMYINLTAIHYPNAHYVEGQKKDDLNSHRAALRYVDSQLERLFAAFKVRNKTFVIAASDHGSCYGEDGFIFHCHNHPIVLTVPYKHFFL